MPRTPTARRGRAPSGGGSSCSSPWGRRSDGPPVAGGAALVAGRAAGLLARRPVGARRLGSRPLVTRRRDTQILGASGGWVGRAGRRERPAAHWGDAVAGKALRSRFHAGRVAAPRRDQLQPV